MGERERMYEIDNFNERENVCEREIEREKQGERYRERDRERGRGGIVRFWSTLSGSVGMMMLRWTRTDR